MPIHRKSSKHKKKKRVTPKRLKRRTGRGQKFGGAESSTY